VWNASSSTRGNETPPPTFPGLQAAGELLDCRQRFDAWVAQAAPANLHAVLPPGAWVCELLDSRQTLHERVVAEAADNQLHRLHVSCNVKHSGLNFSILLSKSRFKTTPYLLQQISMISFERQRN
jgi:hypothetical protein